MRAEQPGTSKRRKDTEGEELKWDTVSGRKNLSVIPCGGALEFKAHIAVGAAVSNGGWVLLLWHQSVFEQGGRGVGP